MPRPCLDQWGRSHAIQVIYRDIVPLGWHISLCYCTAPQESMHSLCHHFKIQHCWLSMVLRPKIVWHGSQWLGQDTQTDKSVGGKS